MSTAAVTATRGTPAPGRRVRPPATTWAVLATLLVATFMAQFDFFVVNVAAPSLRDDLSAGDVGLELVVGAYAFSYAGALVLGGRLGDLYGHRKMFGLGMVGFAVTSALCGISANTAELVVARLAQGFTAALMLPQVLAMIAATFELRERPKAMAWYGVAGGAGSISGQVFGGLLVTADVGGLGWRLIFWINVPIGLLGLVAAARVLPRPATGTPARRTSLDPAGALGLALGLGLVLVPLTLSQSYGWAWWVWVGMVGGGVVLAAVLGWERAVQRRGADPLFDLALLQARSYRAGLLANAAFLAYFASYMFTLALLLQSGLGLDPLEAGLAFAPASVAFSTTALAAPRLFRRFGVAAPVVSAVIVAAGLVALAVLVADATPPVGWVVAVTVVISLGNGAILPTLVGTALADVPPAQAGAAAGALATAQQFAAAAGVAVIGTVFFTAAGSTPIGVHAGSGMAWAAAVCAALVLLMGVVIGVGGRRTEQNG